MAKVSIKSFNKRLEALKKERSTFLPLWRECSDYHLAHRGRFLTTDRNKGYKRNTKQINNTSRLSVRTLASGMMSGITSPARPWFRLSTGDSELDDSTPVKLWLYEVQNTMYNVFSASNFYNSLHQLYGELGVFGTASMGIYKDFENVIWCRPYTVGSYMLGNNDKNENDTFYREYELTVAQTVKMFGIENCSESVQNQWKNGNTEAWVKIVHAIEPNDDRDQNSPLARDMRFRSAYYEAGRGTREDETNKFLRYSGFNEYPIVAPRWDVTGEDVYATDCPGIIALGDTKALQLAERRKYQALDKVANPPLQAPASMKNKIKGAVLNSSEIVYSNDPNNGGLRSIFEHFKPDIPAIRQEIAETEMRIKRAFYEDLFLMLANTDRREITAREVAEKHEEKLLMLGPVLERLHTELLDPAIDRTFSILQEAGVLPVPPPELQNRDLKIEYISILAQAQRMVNTQSIDRMVGYVGAIAAIDPASRHKIDFNQSIDDYAEALGINPAMVRSDEEAKQLAAQEAQMQQMMATMEQAPGLTQAAKTASETLVNDGETNLLDGMAKGSMGQTP